MAELARARSMMKRFNSIQIIQVRSPKIADGEGVYFLLPALLIDKGFIGIDDILPTLK